MCVTHARTPRWLQGASLLCLWPVVLGFSVPSAYAHWREWLVPAHLALQHWIGLRFALPPDAKQLLVRPVGWPPSLCACACWVG